MRTMPNNLNQMIRQANMTKREVAALKGITPENLSRQVNGHTNITLQDAEHYAKILGCSPQDVLFVAPAIPIIGECHISHCNHVMSGIIDSTHDVHVERRIDTRKFHGRVYIQTYYHGNSGAIMWSAEKGYTGLWEHWKETIEFIELDPVQNKYVSENAVQHECYALLEKPYKEFNGGETRLACGILYPEPGGVYTLHNTDTKVTLKGQKMIWASACLGALFRPKLRGAQIVFDD